MPRSQFRSALRFLTLTIVTTLVTFGASMPAHAIPCSSVRMTESFVLPDGTEYPAGELSLCPAGEFSPGASLHRVRVNGRTVAVLTARPASRPEGDLGHHTLLFFSRHDDGLLYLQGYTAPFRGRNALFAFAGPTFRAEGGKPVTLISVVALAPAKRSA